MVGGKKKKNITELELISIKINYLLMEDGEIRTLKMEKWCQSCQQYKKPEIGRYILRGRIRRWSCNSCLERKSSSFISRNKENESN